MKIRKGQPVGCQVILKNKKMYEIIFYLFKIVSNIKYDFSLKITNSKSITFNLFNLFNFNVVEKNFGFFNNVKNLNITLLFDKNINNEIPFILNYLKFLKKETHK